MWFALFDSEHPREELIKMPAAYKIGLYSKYTFPVLTYSHVDLCFGKF
jgi:hypothetical protein